MRLLVFLIKWGLPLLVVTDLGSTIFANPALLNISRGVRMFILLLFIIENIKSIKTIRKFYFSKFLFVFALVHFFYIFTDRIFMEGVWQFSKVLFWILGLNVLFVYRYKNILTIYDFEKVIKRIAVLAFLFTGFCYATGLLESDYNAAAYLGVFIYPFLLYTSNSFKKNKIYILLVAITVMVTIKRGAILAFLATNLVFYSWSLLTQFNFKKFVLGLTVLTVVTVAGFYFIMQQADRVEDRFSEEQMDINNPKGGSGRVGLYTSLFTEWINSDNVIFGFGNQADSHRWGSWRRTHAHSDIFGYLYNFGLVGISLIFIFYIKIIKFYKRYKRYDFQNSPIIIAVLVAMILVNIYSGLFRIQEVLYLFSVFPYFQLQQKIQQ